MDFQDIASPDWLKKKVLAENGVVIFGAGAVGVEFLHVLEKSGIEVLGFLDNFAPLDSPVADKPVWRPYQTPAYIDRKKIEVLIGVLRLDVSPADLETDLRGHGYENISRTLGTFIRRQGLGDIFWGTEPGFYDQSDRVMPMERARHIWADEKSRQVYDGLLAFRKTFDDSYLTPPDANEYFPDDIPAWSEPIRFLM